MKTFKRIMIALFFIAILFSACLSTGAFRMQRIWKWYDHTRLQSDTVTIDSLLVTRCLILKSLTSAPFDSAGLLYYNKTADPGTAYYYNGASWIAFGTHDSVLYADTSEYTKTGFAQGLWDAIQDSCDSVLYADSAFHAYYSDTTDTAYFAWNTESLAAVHASSYLRSDAIDTATAKLHFQDDLTIYQNDYIYWAISNDTVGFLKYNQGTWYLDLEDGIDHFSRADSFVFQTIGEGDNRGISFLDSSGTLIAYFTNDGDLAFNPTNAADIWLLDSLNAKTVSAGETYTLSLSGEDIELNTRAEVGAGIVFSDSSGDDLLTVYNEGGITLHKDWGGQDAWDASVTVDTLEVLGVTNTCAALITPHDGLSTDVWAIAGTDTIFVHRTIGGEVTDDHYSYLILRP